MVEKDIVIGSKLLPLNAFDFFTNGLVGLFDTGHGAGKR